jgi:hypothetical protein
MCYLCEKRQLQYTRFNFTPKEISGFDLKVGRGGEILEKVGVETNNKDF